MQNGPLENLDLDRLMMANENKKNYAIKKQIQTCMFRRLICFGQQNLVAILQNEYPLFNVIFDKNIVKKLNEKKKYETFSGGTRLIRVRFRL